MGLGRVSSEPFSSDETLLVSTFYSNHTVVPGYMANMFHFTIASHMETCLLCGFTPQTIRYSLPWVFICSTQFSAQPFAHILSPISPLTSQKLFIVPCPSGRITIFSLLLSRPLSRAARSVAFASPSPLVCFLPALLSDANAGAQGHRTAISHVGSCVRQPRRFDVSRKALIYCIS